MSDGTGDDTGGEQGRRRGRRGRKLSAEETALWREVTRSIAPIRHRKTVVPEMPPSSPPASPLPAATQPGAAFPAEAPPPPLPTRPVPPKRPAGPPLAPLGRRLVQRLGRGTADIDDRIDLHGLTQEMAHAALLRFLRNAQANGAKTVLVITGKGARAAADPSRGERGVLARLVPQWLALAEFRALVIGFDSAQAGHGGAGALYVRIRRKR